MHEMSLAESVLDIIRDQARSQGFARVTAVWLEIGQLAAVEAEAMRFCFDAVTRGSLAEGAGLKIIEIPGSGRCPACGESIRLNERYDLCPRCDMPVEVTGGTELRVKELEVE